MRTVWITFSILLGCAVAGQAQVNLGDIMRQRQARQAAGNPAGLPGRGGAPADKCKALVAWMGILDREYPQIDFRGTVMDQLAPKVLNLFRDEYFQPFYGKPIGQTTDSERMNYHMTFFRGGCGPNQLSQPELAVLQKFKILVERQFLYGAATVPYQQFAKSLAERQALVQWRNQALRDLPAIPATFAGFDKLETYWQKGGKDLDNLFPSEKQQFLQKVGERRKAFTPAMAQELVQTAAAIPPGLDGAKAIHNLRATYERFLADLDPAAKAQMNARLDQLTSTALRDTIERQKTKLAALPSGIEGALAVLAWRHDFEIELAGVTPTPEMQALLTQAQARRSECLAKGMPAFQALVAQYPKPGPGGRKADDLMAQLFPPQEAQVAEHAQYQSAFAARTEQLKAEEQAKESRARQAKATAAAPLPAAKPAANSAANTPAHPCDALAGHPGDPGHKGDGVTDEELVPIEAIKQCTLAVRQQPKNGRFRFQLGRAYWIARQYDKALESLLSAQEMKYAPACYYLGLAYEQGRVKGEKPDAAFAADLYQMAAAEGFEAEPAMADNAPEQPAPVVEKAEDLDASVFKQPAWVRALFSGDMDTLNRSRAQMLVYARGMDNFVGLDPNEYDASCARLADPSISEKLDFEQTGVGDGKVNLGATLSQAMRLLTAPPRMVMAEAQRNEQTSQDGVDDMSVLSEDYGTCAGPVVQRVYANLKRFVREKPQPKQFTRLSTSHDRPPQPADLRGVTDPGLAARLRQELQDVAAKGFLLTECVYGADVGQTVAAHWKGSVPPLSDSLRAALPGILPMALAHCGPHENYPVAMRNAFKLNMPPAQFVESAPRIQDLRAALPRMLPPAQQAYAQEAAAIRSPLVSCKFSTDARPVLYWRTTLPQIQGTVKWDFLQFVYKYWQVMPAAVSACPPSGSWVSASLTFKDY